VDTSILVEILNVPGRNANREVVLEQLRARRADRSVVIWTMDEALRAWS